MTSNPSRFWRVCWVEMFRESEQDRNFRSSSRAARQVAAILACPDDVAKLSGVWVTSGYADDRLGWTRLDPHQLVEEAGAQPAESDLDPDLLSPADWLQAIRESWREHRERSTGEPAACMPMPGREPGPTSLAGQHASSPTSAFLPRGRTFR